MRMRAWFLVFVAVVVTAFVVSVGPMPADDSALSLQGALARALGRDVLVRDAQNNLENARSLLTRSKTYTPRMSVSSSTSSSSSGGLDPSSEISGTEYSSEYYSSGIDLPLPFGINVGLGGSAYTSTTNSSLRIGGGENYTYAGAASSISGSLPLPIFRNESALTNGARRAAELGLRQAELNLDETRRRVVSDTLGYFFGALSAQRQAEIALASQAENDELLRIAQEKFKLGKVPEIDVMEAQVAADSARASVRRQQSAAANALDTLKDYLGMPLEQEVRLAHEDRQEVAGELDETRLVEQALAQRVDLKQLALSIRAQELYVRQTEALARPGVSISGSYSRSGQGATISESLNNLLNPSWYVGLTGSFSLTRKEDRLAIQQARRALELAQTNQRLQRDAVRLEIRRLLREVQDAAANAQLLAETVKRAEESLQVQQVRYDHGLSRPIDVMQTSNRLEQTRQSYSAALIDYQLAMARLRLAVGEMPQTGMEQQARAQ